MTKRALVIRHLLFEDLGLFEPILLRRGYQIELLDAGVHPLPVSTDADLLIVLGGPIGVNDLEQYPFLATEIQLLQACLTDDIPVLGICLGAQLLAAAMGARVEPSGGVEIGYAPLQLTEEGRAGPLGHLEHTPVLHWHGDRFETPPSATRLAATPGYPSQAFAAGAAVLGLQFHLEADPSRLEQWLIGHAHELATNHIDPDALRRAAAITGETLAERGGRALETWLNQLPRAARARGKAGHA